MMSQFEVKLWVNKFEVKKTCIEFVINNSLSQSNNFKQGGTSFFQDSTYYTKSGRKHADIADFIYCETNGIAPSFYLVLLEAYLESSQTSRMERFVKMVNS